MKANDDIEHIKKHIQSHKGIHALHLFGENFLKIPLKPLDFKIFMATLWAFYKETPSGILDLALRVSDFWRDINPWEANAKAAHILYAGFEEFGLQSLDKIVPTHHQLFKLSSLHFGVTEHDLSSNDYILEAGIAMGKNSRIGYREKSITFGLGYHLAAELTSWWEFKYFYEGIMNHKATYNIGSNNNPALHFFYIHTLVESEHLCQSQKVAEAFIQIDTNGLQDIYSGIELYMQTYQNLFTSLNIKIY